MFHTASPNKHGERFTQQCILTNANTPPPFRCEHAFQVWDDTAHVHVGPNDGVAAAVEKLQAEVVEALGAQVRECAFVDMLPYTHPPPPDSLQPSAHSTPPMQYSLNIVITIDYANPFTI